MTQPILKIDFREKRTGIILEAEKYSHLFQIQLTSLITGDYEIEDKIVIERKSVEDFLSSIKNGRIFQQAYRLAQSGKNGLIIIEGDYKKLYDLGLSRNAIQGALLHLTVFTGVPVIRSANIEETAFLLGELLIQSNRNQLPRNQHIISCKPGIRLNVRQRYKIFMLAQLPGIGIKKGLALLNFFGSFGNIVNANPIELSKVSGVGNNLANRIYKIFHESF